MDFNDTTEEAAFRAEAKAWLEANVPTGEELAGLDEIQAAKLWQKRKYDAGWACIRWPEEYGGRGASAIEQVIWNQEEGQFAVPGSVFGIGQGMAAPTLMAWASEEHKRQHLPAARFRRTHLVPTVQRTGGRFRPRSAAHTRRTRRRRMGHQRPEDLDLGGALLGLRHHRAAYRSQRTETQGPVVLLSRHEVAGNRDPADQANLRRCELQRGLLHRCARARRSAPRCGRPRLAGRHHHADE